jgi:hypothetical protein
MSEDTATTAYGDFKHEILNEITSRLNMPHNVAARRRESGSDLENTNLRGTTSVEARPGRAWPGAAWHGTAWPGWARQGFH